MIVSSGVGSGDFVPVFKDVAVPMIVFGNSAYSNLGWITGSSGKGTVGSTTLVSLVDATTPLVSDLMTGVGFKMILDSRSTSLYWGTPAAAAIRAVSIMGQSAQLVVVRLREERGADDGDGGGTAGRLRREDRLDPGPDHRRFQIAHGRRRVDRGR